MNALAIYLVLTKLHTWEFMAIEHTGNIAYCEMLKGELVHVFADRPGNMRILCVDDLEIEA
jgi:hypothetical protein